MYRLVLLAVGSAIAMFVAAQLALSRHTTAPGEADSKPAIRAMKASTNPPESGDETEIARDPSGQFHLRARVNGQDARFLIDTGADVVALTVEQARGLGLDFNPDAFEPIGRSASGQARGVRVHLDRFQLGDDEFHNVDAVILEGLETNLLGQSLLRRLGKVELRGDRMVIRHS
jgi:aspartyl protease family protein